MTRHVSPAVRLYLTALVHRPEEAESARAVFLDWLVAAEDSLKTLRPVLLLAESTLELLHQAELDLREVRRTLDDPKLQPEARVQALESAIARYYQQLFQLQQEEVHRPAFSPVLTLDQLVRTCLNQKHGRGDVNDLRLRFSLAVAEVQHLRHDLQIRQALFPEMSWPPEVAEALDRVEGGLGAVAQYLDGGEVALLDDAVQLLGRASTDYASALSQLSPQPRFSRHDSLECWCRALEHPYDLGVTQAFWDRLFQEVDAFLRQVQTARVAGLGVAEPALLAEAGLAHQQTLDQLSSLPDGASAQAALLHPLWEQLAALSEKMQTRLGEVHQSLENAPRMAELLEQLGQSQAGVIPAWMLELYLSDLLESQKRSLEALQKNPDGERLQPVLSSHAMAYERMLLYCQDQNPEHLVEGWKLVSLTLPPLLEFESQLRRKVSQTGRSGQQVTCVRCGLVQPIQRMCQSCGSVLPQMQLDEVRYDDIAGGPDKGQSAADDMADLIHAVQFGTASWDQLEAEIIQQIQTLQKTRTRFEQELLKLQGKNDTLDAYSHFFVLSMGKLSEVLGSLSDSARARNVALLKATLGSYRQLHEELIEFQRKIQEGMAKR